MSWTYTPGDSSSRNMVRLLIPDKDENNPIFDDEELDIFLSLESGSVLHGSALALETMASNEVFIQKVTKIGDVTVDGAKVSQELRMRAKTLRDRARVTGDIDTTGWFDWAEWIVGPFTETEHFIKELQRTGL